MDVNYSVIIFYSSSLAIKAEKLMKNAGLTVKLIPIPRNLSSDCSVCLRFESKYSEKVLNILENEEIEYNSIHQIGVM